MKTFSAKRTAIYIFCLTLLSKCFGFLREVCIANSFGTSFVTDAYVLSTSIPGMLFGGILGAIGTAYTPVYSRVVEKGKDGNKFTSQLITVVESVAVLSSVVGLLFAPQIAGLVAKNFSHQALELCIFYTRVAFSFALFTSAKSILDAFLRYKNIFIPQMIGDYVQNICVITATVISAKTNNHYLIFGLFFGYFISCLVTYAISKKEDFRYRMQFNVNAEIKEVLVFALPVFLSSELATVNTFIDRYLAAGLKTGSISSLQYGSIIATLALTLTASIISTVMYPKITKDAANENWNHYKETCQRCITMDLMIVIPCAIGFAAFSNEIIQVIYERGAFGGTSTQMTAIALLMYSFMVPFSAIQSVLSQMCYSLEDSKSPFICGIVAVPVNIALNLILVSKMAHAGLALATSISAAISMTLLSIIFSVKHKHAKLHIDIKKLLIIIAASCISIGLAKPFYNLIHKYIMSRTILLGLSGCFAAVLYFALLTITKVDEYKEFFSK